MFRAIILSRVCGLARKSNFDGSYRNLKITSARLEVQRCPCRFMSRIPRKGKTENDDMPEAPPMSSEDLDFFDDLLKEEKNIGQGPSKIGTSPLPPAPPIDSEWDDIANAAENDDIVDDDVEDIEAVPYIPPIHKTIMLNGDSGLNSPAFLTSAGSDGSSKTVEGEKHWMISQLNQMGGDVMLNPKMREAIAAWARAVVPTAATGPMPLHELANRSKKIKELVKLGVDFSKIVKRHGDMERFLQLDWDAHIKPQIQFLVDCGINPQNLGKIFTQNTPLIWTDRDDIQVRINYLEAKLFTKEEINSILNKAPNWLTLPTKELDSRLGFIQSTFKLTGNEVREVVCNSPKMMSCTNKNWAVVVDSVKLMEREFGFNHWERKELLIKRGSCYAKPGVVREAFNYCHDQIGLTHTQLARHAGILLSRVNRLKTRYEFLKFLKRDTFNIDDPLYTSPDWLFKGTAEEFCEKAAKCTFEDYENFLKYS